MFSTDRQPTQTVFVPNRCCNHHEYFIANNTWRRFQEIPKILDSIGACCHSTNSMVYVAGKSSSNPHVCNMCAYDTRNKKWLIKASTHRNHCVEKLSLVELKDCLYALGKSGVDSRCDIEEYSIDNDQWTIVDLRGSPCRKVPTHSFWSFAFRGDIFISGGNLDPDDEDSSDSSNSDYDNCNRRIEVQSERENAESILSCSCINPR